MSQWPEHTEDDGEISSTTIRYFGESLAEYLKLPRQHKPFGELRADKPLGDYNSELGSIIRRAFQDSRSHVQVAALLRALCPHFMVDYLSTRTPEYLRTLWPAILDSGQDLLWDWAPARRVHFLDWLDRSLLEAGCSEDDIDLSWRSYVSRFLSMADDHELESTREARLGNLIPTLPDRIQQSIYNSHVGKILQKRFGQTVKYERRFSWRLPTGHEAVEVSLSVKDLNRVVEEGLERTLSGSVWKESRGGFTFDAKRRTPDNFFVEIRALPEPDKGAPQEAEPLAMAFNVIGFFFHDNPQSRHSAWKAGLAKLRRFDRDTYSWEALDKPLLKESTGEWKSAAQSCVDLLLQDRAIAVNILLESFEGGSSFLTDILPLLTLEHVRHWFSLSADDLADGDALPKWAQRIAPAKDSKLDDWDEIRELAYHSLFPDAEVFRRAFVSKAGKEPARHVQPLKNLIFKLLEEAETNPSPQYKINIVLTVIQLIEHQAQASGLQSAGDLWKSLPESGRARPVYSRVETLLLEALVIPRIMFDIGTDEPSELVALASVWGSALSALWQRQDDSFCPEVRRYLSSLVGGYLSAKVCQKKTDTGAAVWRELREALAGIALESAWIRPDTEPGFYRPSLGMSLHYPAAFAVKSLRQHMHSVKGYIMSDSLLKRLFELGEIHRRFFALLWKETPALSWLDSSLDPTMTAGVDLFIRESYGDSIKLLRSEERERLDALQERPDPDEVLEECFKRIMSGSGEEGKGLFDLILRGLWLKYLSGSDWETWLGHVMEDNFLDRIEEYGDEYWILVITLSQILLRSDLDSATEKRLLELVFRDPTKLGSEAGLETHIDALILLLKNKWYDDRVDTWLLRLAKEDSITLHVRRRLVRRLIDRYDKMPEGVRTRLNLVLHKMAGLPNWKGMIELDQFAGTIG